MLRINQLTARVNEISIISDNIAKAIDAFEAYSYQNNIKTAGMLALSENESS